MKPIRSLLFVPAHREGWPRKAVAAGADGIILDLEDSVPNSLKLEGREVARQSVRELRDSGSDVQIYIRLNALDTGLAGDDINAMSIEGVQGFVLPKLMGRDDVIRYEALTDHFEEKNGLEPGSLKFICNFETAESYAECSEIAKASPRVATLAAGTARDADVSRSLGFNFTPGGEETLYLRSRIILACRANGLSHPLVGVWQDLEDDEGARRFSEYNRDLGFRGQLLIHPKHVSIANEVYSPSQAEVEFYRNMITAFEAAEADGRAAVTYEGMHVDYAHIKTAQEVLSYAEQFAGANS